MILGIVIGLVVGALLAALALGLFGGSLHADLEAEKWRLERENFRLQAELGQRGQVS